MHEPPYFAIPMPLNAKGEGPAGAHETVRTIWQVWDACNCTVAEYPTQIEAEQTAARLNSLCQK